MHSLVCVCMHDMCMRRLAAAYSLYVSLRSESLGARECRPVWGGHIRGTSALVGPGNGSFALEAGRGRPDPMSLCLVFSRCASTEMGQVNGLGQGLGEKQGRRVGRSSCFPAAQRQSAQAPHSQLPGRRGGGLIPRPWAPGSRLQTQSKAHLCGTALRRVFGCPSRVSCGKQGPG